MSSSAFMFEAGVWDMLADVDRTETMLADVDRTETMLSSIHV